MKGVTGRGGSKWTRSRPACRPTSEYLRTESLESGVFRIPRRRPSTRNLDFPSLRPRFRGLIDRGESRLSGVDRVLSHISFFPYNNFAILCNRIWIEHSAKNSHQEEKGKEKSPSSISTARISEERWRNNSF